MTKFVNYLIKYGLDEFFIKQVAPANIPDIARLTAVHKKYCLALNSAGQTLKAIVKGELLHFRAVNNRDLPQVGDFVVLQNNHENPLTDSFFIQEILQRKSIFKRKIVGKKQDMQILAVNVDYVFITMSLDHQFNLNRLERFLVAAFDSQITPVIVLTKSDLTPTPNQFAHAINEKFPNIATIVTTMIDIATFNPLKEYLVNHKTGVLVGVSGSGKSTITNILLAQDIQKIGAVSKEKDKGKHTTTHREIFLLASGGCIIDSPGIKEFGLHLDNEYNLNDAFADIITAAKFCKFRNCSHTSEPNCAVLAKVNAGEISRERLNNYLYLLKEQQTKQNVSRKIAKVTKKK